MIKFDGKKTGIFAAGVAFGTAVHSSNIGKKKRREYQYGDT